jgi:hypothetical protein
MSIVDPFRSLEFDRVAVNQTTPPPNSETGLGELTSIRASDKDHCSFGHHCHTMGLDCRRAVIANRSGIKYFLVILNKGE